MDLGVYLPTWDPQFRWHDVERLAQLVEQSGYQTLWLADHDTTTLSPEVLRAWLGLESDGPDGPKDSYMDCWTVLSALAAITRQISIGPLISPTLFRHPALLAKMASTLTHISGDRLILGLGTGVPLADSSFRSYQLPSDNLVSRFAEAVEIIARLLREGQVAFQGQYYQVETTLYPRSVAPQRPPVWIGTTAQGSRMPEIAARWADVVHLNVLLSDPNTVAELSARIDQACIKVGRDPATLGRAGVCLIALNDDVEMTGMRTLALRGAPEELAEQLLAIQAHGKLQEMLCLLDIGETPGPLVHLPVLRPESLERFAPVKEALDRLAPATSISPAFQ